MLSTMLSGVIGCSTLWMFHERSTSERRSYYFRFFSGTNWKGNCFLLFFLLGNNYRWIGWYVSWCPPCYVIINFTISIGHIGMWENMYWTYNMVGWDSLLLHDNVKSRLRIERFPTSIIAAQRWRWVGGGGITWQTRFLHQVARRSHTLGASTQRNLYLQH